MHYSTAKNENQQQNEIFKNKICKIQEKNRKLYGNFEIVEQ